MSSILDPTAVAEMDPQRAIMSLMPDIRQAAERLKAHSERTDNWLKVKYGPDGTPESGWEAKVARQGWPAGYETRVGNIILTYAVEDRTISGPYNLRFRARVLSVCYINVNDAEIASAIGTDYIQPPMRVARELAMRISNCFFTGLVASVQQANGDWVFVQKLGDENKTVVPGENKSLIVLP